MIYAMIVDNNDQEEQLIGKTMKDSVALLSDDRIDLIMCRNSKELIRVFNEREIMNVACVDAEVEVGIKNAEDIRHRYPKAHIMLVAGEKQSPLMYIRPSIMASALVIRPINKAILTKKLNELIEALTSKDAKEDGVFVIEEKEGVTNIPYAEICYFEARNKKIYVRLKSSEYGFYATLDELEADLPDGFLRCHRGFIANMSKMKRYSTSENMLYLENDIMVPLSRSYRSSVRKWIYEKSK